MISFSQYLIEAKYPLYHKTFTSASQAALDLAKKQGFEVDEDDWFKQVSTGPKKPGKGKTNRYVVKVTKKGKDTKKRLAFQVYGMDSGKYELNAYVESTDIEEAKDSVIDQVKAIVANKQASKISGKMIDMQTASFISQIYDKVNSAVKKKMEKDKIENLVKLAQKVMAKENIGVQDGRRVVVKALTKSAALRLLKKLKNKFSSWDTSIDKDGLSMIVPNEKHIVRYLQKQPEVDTIGEATDLEEAVKFWTVTITKKAGKLFKGQTVDVKARNSAEAIKKGIKQMKGDPMIVPSGSVDAVLGESIKESRTDDLEKTNVRKNKV